MNHVLITANFAAYNAGWECADAIVNLTSVVVTDNYATVRVGGVELKHTVGVAKNCTISRNQAYEVRCALKEAVSGECGASRCWD